MARPRIYKRRRRRKEKKDINIEVEEEEKEEGEKVSHRCNSTEAQQAPRGDPHRATTRQQHLVPPALPHQRVGILLRKPDAQAGDAPEHRRQRVLVALADGHDALVEAVALVGVCRDGGDEDGPDGVDARVEVALHGQGEDHGGEGVVELHDGGVEARQAVRVCQNTGVTERRGEEDDDLPVETAPEVD